MTAAVSILLPARDAAATLPACLRSIARQRHADFDCAIVDDHSNDATAAIARAFAAGDARFRVVPNDGRGLVAALQTGLRHCAGEFMARMDADDVMHRDRLALQLAMLRADATLAGVGCHARAFPSRALAAGMRAYLTWLRSMRDADAVQREAFVECPLLHPTWLLRGDILRAHGYRSVPWAEDYDLLLRLLQAGHRLGVVPRTLLGWRRGERTATATDPRYAAAGFVRCKAAFLASGPLAGGSDYVLWGHGATGRALKRALAAEGKRAVAIVELHPRRLGRTIGGAPVVPPDAVPGLLPLPIVVSVAGAANRALLRARLHALGCVELRDYVFAA